MAGSVGWLINIYPNYPIETPIIDATLSGLGGTGDITILTAGNRMVLMPLAQVATQIGIEIVVTKTLVVLLQVEIVPRDARQRKHRRWISSSLLPIRKRSHY